MATPLAVQMKQALQRGDFRAVVAMAEAAGEVADDLEGARFRLLQAQAQSYVGQLTESLVVARAVLERARAAGWEEAERHALLRIAWTEAKRRGFAHVAPLAERLAGLATDADDLSTLGDAHRLLSVYALDVGDGPRSLRHLQVAEACFAQTGSEHRLLLTMTQLSRSYYLDNELDEALRLILDVQRRAGERGFRGVGARAREVRSAILLATARLEEAEVALTEAWETYLDLGYLHGLADTANDLGEVARRRGKLEVAERWYREALVRADTEGGWRARLFPQINLGLVLLARERWQEAYDALDEARRGTRRELALYASLCALVLPALAALGEAAEFDSALGFGAARLRWLGRGEEDVAYAFRQAAEKAAERRWYGRAARCRELAAWAWEMLGRPAELRTEESALMALADEGEPLPVGPFDILNPVGRGGMGEVWRGVHRETGSAVAVKFVPGVHSEAFEREVRATARLSHPHVVRVLDVGRAPRTVSVATGARVAAGAPYIAMEFVDRGSLAGRGGSFPWSAIRNILLSVLDGLAHAHARGILHLDIKPGNILMRSAPGGAVSALLADFGLARSARDTGTAAVVRGTPRYMAPEQFSVNTRMYGPWTDLYAVGCLAVYLATGHPPFRQRGVAALAEAHRSEPVPPMHAAVEVPQNFEPWVRRLLGKQPWERFRYPAQAAAALRSLPVLDNMEAPEESGIELDSTFEFDATTLQITDSNLESVGPAGKVEPGHVPRRTVPESWLAARPSVPSRALVDAGLGLFDYRVPPLVGREAERDLVWRELRQVGDARCARMLFVRGGKGIGKTAVARWVCERVHELGVAWVVPVRCLPLAQPGSALVDAVRGFLGTEGLDGVDAATQATYRLESELGALSDASVAPIAELVSGIGLAPASRYAGVRRMIELLSGICPVILSIQDAHYDVDTLHFARTLLAGRPVPVFVLAEVGDHALAEQSERTRSVCEALAGRADVVELTLEGLSIARTTEMLLARVGLEPALARLVAERSGGNPQYAVSAVAGWLERDELIASDAGFVLHPAAHHELPEDLYQLWRGRIARLLEGLPGPGRRALELLAVAGDEVSVQDWSSACDNEIPPTLLDRLAAGRLARSTSTGWSLRGEALRECVIRRASERGEARSAHLAWAEVLEDRPDLASRLRRGRHLLDGGAPHEAEALLRAIVQRSLQVDDVPVVEASLELWRRAMALAGLDEESPDFLQAWTQAAIFETIHGDVERAIGSAQRALRIAQGTAEVAVQVRLLITLATAQSRCGRHADALLSAESAMGLVDGAPAAIRSAALWRLAGVLRLVGRYQEAERMLRDALAGAAPGSMAQMRALDGLGSLELARGNATQAEAYLREMLEVVEQGNVHILGSAYNNLAEALQMQERYDEAEAAYLRCIETWAGSGSARASVGRLNLAVLRVRRGDLEVALDDLDRCEAGLAGTGRVDVSQVLSAARLAARPYADGPETRRALEEIASREATVSPEVLGLLRLAAERAREAGRLDSVTELERFMNHQAAIRGTGSSD